MHKKTATSFDITVLTYLPFGITYSIYRFIWSEHKDSNLGPPAPKAGALPDCAILRNEVYGVANGTRTHDNRDHNPGLYQLSYSHHRVHYHAFFIFGGLNGAPDRIRTCDHPLRRRVLYPTELQAHDRRINKPPCDVSLKLVGAQGFEPWTPCSQSRCATRLRHTPIIFSFVSYVVRYGVHSRRDSVTRQHLDLKKMKLCPQPSIYPPKALISLVFQRFRLAVKFNMRSKGSLARRASAGSTWIS